MSAKRLIQGFIERVPSTAQLRLFGLAKIPLMFLVNPKVVSLTDESCKVMVPLNYMTKNHLGSMYFGALAIGADTVVALLALNLFKKYSHVKLSLIFKDLSAEFLKRAEGNVVFCCEAGRRIESMVETAIDTKGRITEPIEVLAMVPSLSDEPVARFELGLSLKVIDPKPRI